MGEPIQDPVFYVHFENRNVAFANGFMRMFHGGNQFDVTLQVEDKELKAHRHILSSVSDALRMEFEQHRTFGAIKVEWHGSKYDVVKDILHYIYNGSVKIYKRDMEAFVAAAQFMDITTDLQDLDVPIIMGGMKDDVPAEIIWNAWGEDFVTRFQALYTAKKRFDVTLQIDGKELHAHRHVLSACSNYFEPMFSWVDMSAPLIVPLDNMESVTYELLRNILDFIYLGVVKVTDLVPLLNAAEELEIYGLLPDDALETNRPDSNAPQSNVIHVYARTHEFNQNKRVDIKSNTLNKLKTRHATRMSNDDSDSAMTLRRRNPQMSSAAPKKVISTRKQKVASVEEQKPINVEKTVRKVKKVPKARATARPKSEAWNVEETPENNTKCERQSMDIRLTRQEFEQFYDELGQRSECLGEGEDITWDNEDGAIGYTPQGERDEFYVDDQTLEPSASMALKHKREDLNNNEHTYDCEQFDFPEDDNASCDEDYVPDYECNQSKNDDCVNKCVYESDDGAVGGPLVLWDSDLPTKHDTSFEECPIDDKPMPKSRSKGTRILANRGVGNNAAPINDSEYDTEANLIRTERGAEALQHEGFRYLKNHHGIEFMRWTCNHKENHKNCNVKAYTKMINGVTMACFPPNDMHGHGPREEWS